MNIRSRSIGLIINSLIVTCLIFSTVSPVPVIASSGMNSTGTKNYSVQKIVPQYYFPLSILNSHSPNEKENTVNDDIPSEPSKGNVGFTLSTEQGALTPGVPFLLTATILNKSKTNLQGFKFDSILPEGIELISRTNDVITYSSKRNEVSYLLPDIQPGQLFSFTFLVNAPKATKEDLFVFSGEIYRFLGIVKYSDTLILGVKNSEFSSYTKLEVLNPNGGWHSTGKVDIYLSSKDIETNSFLSVTKLEGVKGGPQSQFKLDVFNSTNFSRDLFGNLKASESNIKSHGNTKFADSAYIKFRFNDVMSLKAIPAGKEPYVAVFDEVNQIWVKVPILQEDVENNTVVVEAKHFSTWGIGLGDSLPQNGAGALLFDKPYTSSFTGSSTYSIPISIPAGRAGLTPSINLSYSSSTVDGVLGDVQAPWVGVGWNIDDIEIVRKITSDEEAYGYINSFALTINGTIYNLIRDAKDISRYYVNQDAFLYIKRHNYALDGSNNYKNVQPNTTGEWWEVVTTDGTHYRLGYNKDSEQTALMYGYSCKSEGINCVSPDNAYASSGYAGIAENLVARRWRVDQITDSHGNYIDYSYQEFQPDPISQMPAYDRESYIKSIEYTGYKDPSGNSSEDLLPGYEVKFNLEDRSTIGDVPETYNVWDIYDTKLLDTVTINCINDCEIVPPINSNDPDKIKTYDLNYELADVPNDNGTLLLKSITISGGGYSEVIQTEKVSHPGEFNTEQVEVPEVVSPQIDFTYTNLQNRASDDEHTYPRLESIDNGYGAVLTYSYENDGRGTNSWYNYRVSNLTVTNGLGYATKQSYQYTDPIYAGANGSATLGELYGYKNSSDFLLDFYNNDSIVSRTDHEFGDSGLDIGKELATSVKDPTGKILQKKVFTYITDNSEAPSESWNYRYLASESTYLPSGNDLKETSKKKYFRDGSTGNLLSQSEYVDSELYRTTFFEYTSNTDPGTYILDRMTRQLVVDPSNKIQSDTRYYYDLADGKLTKGDLNLVQQKVGDNDSTVDVRYSYDAYGNKTQSISYKNFGTVGTIPSIPAVTDTSALITSFEYDPSLNTFQIKVTNPLGQFNSSGYYLTLGKVYKTEDPNHWITKTTYDGLGRTLSVSPVGLGQVGTYYNYPTASGSKISAPYAISVQIFDSTVNRYRTVWGIYDGLGRVIQNQVLDEENNKTLTTSVSFDASGNVKYQGDPVEIDAFPGVYLSPNWVSTSKTINSYDPLGRIIKSTSQGGKSSFTSYDGLLTTFVDPKGNKKTQEVDGLGRVIEVQEYSDNSVYSTTRYEYDVMDHLIKVYDANSNSTSLSYNWLGQKISMDDMDMGDWHYTYNGLGNLTGQIDARGKELKFVYDSLGQLTNKKYVVDPENSIDLAVFTYGDIPGKIGFRTKMIDQSGQTDWAYSNYGRTIIETRNMSGSNKSVTTTTDWLGRTLQVTNPDGEVLKYNYDSLGRPVNLTSQSNNSQSTIASLAYNSLSQITTAQLGSSPNLPVKITNQYNQDHLLISKIAVNSSDAQLLNFSYTYDDNGNIVNILDGKLNENQTFSYDSLNRLTAAQSVQTGQSNTNIYNYKYSYDKVGNILMVNSELPLTNNTTTATPSGTSQSSIFRNDINNINQVNYSLPIHLYSGEETDTETVTPVQTETETQTPSPTISASDSPTLTQTETPQLTSTETPTQTVSNSPSPLPTETATTVYTPQSATVYTVEIQPDEASSNDTYINKTPSGGNSNFGNNASLLIGPGLRSLIKFDLSTIPSNAIITSASIVLTSKMDSTINRILAAYRLNQNWVEGTGVADSGADWNAYDATHAWLVAGGGIGQDYSTEIVGSASLTTSLLANTNVSLSLNSSVLQAILTGDYLNYGFILKSTNETSGSYEFYSSSATVGSYRPKLVVSFTIPSSESTLTPTFTATSTPTPATTPTPTKSPTATKTTTPTPGLANSEKAYWTFNTATNPSYLSSGVSYAGTANAGIATYPSGHLGNSVIFDGEGGKITYGDNSIFTLTNGFTYTFWINPITLVKDKKAYIIQKPNEYDVYLLDDGTLEMYFEDLSPTKLKGPVVPFNNWSFVAIEYDKNEGQLRIFFNGVLISSTEVTGTLVNTSSSLIFGGNSISESFYGRIDESKLFSRALTSEEILTVYGMQDITPTASVTPTLVSTQSNTATPGYENFELSLNPVADSYISSLDSNVNYGLSTVDKIGRSTNGGMRTLLQFDLSSIPENATINSASLKLVVAADSSSNQRTLSVYRLLKNWSESWVSWTSYTQNKNWDGNGAAAATDKDSVAIGSIIVSANPSINSTLTINLAPEKIQEFTNNSFENNGFLLKVDTESGDLIDYYSRTSANQSYWPILQVSYSVPASSSLSPTPLATIFSEIENSGGSGLDGDLVLPVTLLPTAEPTGTPTKFPSPTATSTTPQSVFNLNTDKSTSSRSCPDGAAYSVITLSDGFAKLSEKPPVGCFVREDEILLINLQGSTAGYSNTGKFEFLRVNRVSGDTVYFATQKKLWYGESAEQDDNIGIDDDQQRVMVMRVPNYEDVTIPAGYSISAEAWDGYKYGVVAFRASGVLNVAGAISADSLGFKGGPGKATGCGHQGESIDGLGVTSRYANIGGGGGSVSNRQNGSGGGYGAPGTGTRGGYSYGDSYLNKLYLGSGGGAGYCYNEGTTYYAGGGGGSGGGIVFVGSQSISVAGSITSSGVNGKKQNGMSGGGGSGGSVLIESRDIQDIDAIIAVGGVGDHSVTYEVGDGGFGRVAIYYHSSIGAVISTPYAYVEDAGQATPVSTPTPVTTETPDPYGNGADGNLNIASGTTFNIGKDNSSSTRTCQDGGDGVSYQVTELTDLWAAINKIPASSCLAPGDEIMLINIQGNDDSTENTGVYEFLRVKSISRNVVYFENPKTKSFGDSKDKDDIVVDYSLKQYVVLQRIPNYQNVEINGILTTNAWSISNNGKNLDDWDGSQSGIIAFRVRGNFTGNGDISANGLGFSGGRGSSSSGGQQGESHCGIGILATSSANCGGGGGGAYPGHNGSGAGYAAIGTGSNGGKIFGDLQIDRLYLGAGGGGGAASPDGTSAWHAGVSGGDGGGVIFLMANTVAFDGTFSAEGTSGGINNDSAGSGSGGSGGSVRIEAENVSGNCDLSLTGGSEKVAGSVGRSAVYYSGTFSAASLAPAYLEKTGTSAHEDLVSDDFETGSVDATKWAVMPTESANIGVSSSANYWGKYGLSVIPQQNVDTYIQSKITMSENQFHARFYLQPGAVQLPTATATALAPTNTPTAFYYLTSTLPATSTPTRTLTPTRTPAATPTGSATPANSTAMEVYVGYSGNTPAFRLRVFQPTNLSLQIRAEAWNGDKWKESGWYAIDSGWNGVEVAYYAGAGTGKLELWVKGELKETVSELNNANLPITSVRMGAMGVTTSAFNSVKFDDYVSRRTSPIGLLEDPGKTIATPTEIANWTNKSYTYSDSAHIHAVTTMTVKDAANNIQTNSYEYDENGNMTCRQEKGTTYIQSYNTENRLSEIKSNAIDCSHSGNDENPTWQFIYDGDGNKVIQVYKVNKTTTTTYYFAGGSYEMQVAGSGTTTTQYYSIGGVSVGMRKGGTLSYFLTDHLGSVIGITDEEGVLTSETRYTPFGEVRTDVGEIGGTDYGFTFQKVVTGSGLMDYKARMYDAFTGRFIQPDTLVPEPGSSQGYNRYTYVNNNPVRYTDPTGNCTGYSWCYIPTNTPISGDSGDNGSATGNANESESDSAYNTQREEALKCQAGNVVYCSYGEQHPFELTFFLLNSIITPGWTFFMSMYEGIFEEDLYSAGNSIDASLIPAGALYQWEVSTGQYRSLVTGRFISAADLPWPDNSISSSTTLDADFVIDRYGKLSGRYASVPGTLISERGLPPGSEEMAYTQLRVVNPITVNLRISQPVSEFGAIGGGTEYIFSNSLQYWINMGFLEIIR